jgi:prephenate dehydratase
MERTRMQNVDLYGSSADAAYQGAPGAYSEEAAQQLLGPAARLMPCATIEQTFDAVADGRANHAVVPVDGALFGTVAATYDLLLSHELQVSGETLINIDHVLVAPPGTRLGGIRRVLSHPIALNQCADFFRAHPGIEAVSVFDTAGAVRLAMEAPDRGAAAIASRRAAALYGAAIISEHVQDHVDNWTRFLLLSPAQHTRAAGTPTKAFVAFGLRHEPGALVRALQPIAAADLSVTKIEGRPIRGTPFEYRFVVEMVAAEGRTITDSAFDALRQATTWLKVLGAF